MKKKKVPAKAAPGTTGTPAKPAAGTSTPPAKTQP